MRRMMSIFAVTTIMATMFAMTEVRDYSKANDPGNRDTCRRHDQKPSPVFCPSLCSGFIRF